MCSHWRCVPAGLCVPLAASKHILLRLCFWLYCSTPNLRSTWARDKSETSKAEHKRVLGLADRYPCFAPDCGHGRFSEVNSRRELSALPTPENPNSPKTPLRALSGALNRRSLPKPPPRTFSPRSSLSESSGAAQATRKSARKPTTTPRRTEKRLRAVLSSNEPATSTRCPLISWWMCGASSIPEYDPAELAFAVDQKTGRGSRSDRRNC